MRTAGMLSGCINEQPALQIECGGVGQELIEIGIRNALRRCPFVFAVPDEDAVVVEPPRKIGLERYASLEVKMQPSANRPLREGAGRNGERLSEGSDDEVLEDRCHIE